MKALAPGRTVARAAATGPALVVAFALSACQLVFPLPDEASGGGPSASEAVATDGASTGANACGGAECATYCANIAATCAGAPQYHADAECCAICATWDATARACHAVTGGDPLSCTHAGPFGGASGCNDACRALCDTYRAVCGEEAPDDCESECAIKWGPLITFDACHPGPDGSRSCRMSRLLEAAETDPETRKEACKRAKDGKCMPGMGGNPCG